MKTKSKLFTVFGVFVGYNFINRRKSTKLELPINKILLPQNQSKNAIVVGAGVAGVSTAHELGKKGYNVVVLFNARIVFYQFYCCTFSGVLLVPVFCMLK